MLSLTKQCSSFRLSTHLKANGHKQEGLFWWGKSEVSNEYELHFRESTAFKVSPGECVSVTPADVITILQNSGITSYHVFYANENWRYRLQEHISHELFKTCADAYAGLLLNAINFKLIKEN